MNNLLETFKVPFVYFTYFCGGGLFGTVREKCTSYGDVFELLKVINIFNVNVGKRLYQTFL